MWACHGACGRVGSSARLSPLRIGEAAEQRSEIREVKEKRGKSGRLVFVTVGHAVHQGGQPCVKEEQVIVYREAQRRPDVRVHAQSNPSPAPQPANAAAHPAAIWTRTFTPTTVTLFQYSALTYNGHRIHYDHRYATRTEGYPGLLVHGPLTALLLLDAARRHHSAAPSSFRYRALAPLYADEPITLAVRSDATAAAREGAREGREPAETSPGERIVEALAPGGTVAMRGRVG